MNLKSEYNRDALDLGLVIRKTLPAKSNIMLIGKEQDEFSCIFELIYRVIEYLYPGVLSECILYYIVNYR